MIDWKAHLRQGLEDDGWQWDWTTLGTLKRPEQRVRAKIVAKAPGTWAGNELLTALEQVSAELGQPIRTRALCDDGQRVKPRDVVARWEGPARVLLALERPFLNLAQYASGVATQTSLLVDAVRKAARGFPAPRVTSTRKTLPGYRDLAIYGVRAGGGHSHRVSLSGGVLIKENHIAAAGGIPRAVQGVRAQAPHGLKLEVEVRNAKELQQALDAGAEAVLLDNFSPEQVRAAIRQIGGRDVVVEVSGGVNAANIGRYVMKGVDLISSGSLTHSVTALDLSLLVGN
jgi:nicotinate-nucleotide pyrophosphorylase (carboxylating)